MGARRLKSKTLYDTSSQYERPEDLVFFVDECLGKRVVAALNEAGVHVRSHAGNVAIGARDEDWLTIAGKNKWVVLTRDKKIRHREIERKALLSANVRSFVLTAGNLRGEEMAELFSKCVPKMLDLALKQPPPFIARISRSGIVELC